ncbi:hypothetical protein [uncultured Neptuniibacter sp.]|uniref:hypothetical protein n=1 Tax=uncultured Neptuniibacter sp. TaxID=502143 RepID=UPI00261751CB|nr:hypothetical protein [uncultured Neptuniibacter sp.]
MGNESLSRLLDEWEKRARKINGRRSETLSIYQSDIIKLEALAAMYELPKDDVVATLIHEALNELEAKMPYVQGSKVIRIEDGEEIFEDAGPMPKYIAEQKRLLDAS